MLPLLPILGAGGLILGGATILRVLTGGRNQAWPLNPNPLDEQIELLRAISMSRLAPQRVVLQAGDHIRVPCWFGPIPYHHHGIVTWDPEGNRQAAIHYDSGMEAGGIFSIKQQKRAAAVRQTSLDRFVGKAGLDAIELVERPHDSLPVLTRAYSALGSELWTEGTYDLRSNNCEHFARWCIGGLGYSQQVVNYSILRSGIGACVSAIVRRLVGGTIGRIAAALGLGYLVPGIGWILIGAGILYAGYELAKGLGFWCNGHRAEIGGADVRRAALACGVQFA